MAFPAFPRTVRFVVCLFGFRFLERRVRVWGLRCGEGKLLKTVGFRMGLREFGLTCMPACA